MSSRKRLARWVKATQSLPLIYKIPALATAGLLIVYGLIFLPPKAVVFSYASPETCVGYPSLFPGVLRQHSDGNFRVRAGGLVRLAGVVIASTKACVSPTKAPTAGTHGAGVSLGGWLFKKSFAIRVDAVPRVDMRLLEKPVPVAQPLVLGLDKTDAIFTYRLGVNGTETDCTAVQKGISCDVPVLKLRQGAAYTVQLTRYFGGKETAKIKKHVKTLAATRIIKTPFKPGTTVYAKPRSFGFTFDKRLKTALVRLYALKRKSKQVVASQMVINGASLTLKLKTDLARDSAYVLMIDNLEAVDGSSLITPYALNFKTSGGPRVIGTNMGATGVPLGSTFVLTFDQTLSATQDVGGILTLGGGAKYAGKSGNQLFINLAAVPRCGDFSIKLTHSLQSNYGIAGNSAWSLGGRMLCHTTQVIGYSASGRPITAYVFGSGSAVLYTGAIHGSELSTRSLLYYWIDDLEANARSIPAGRSVVVVPEINPDGAAMGSRTNAHNVDLNRNFATSDWRKDITDINNHPFPGGGGPSPMSEPEVRTIASYAAQLRPSLILSYHSIGGVVAANQAGASNSYASTYSQLSGYGNVTGQSGETFDYSISGTADDYYAQKLGIASILVELGSHTYSQFGRNQAAMWAMLR